MTNKFVSTLQNQLEEIKNTGDSFRSLQFKADKEELLEILKFLESLEGKNYKLFINYDNRNDFLLGRYIPLEYIITESFDK